MATTVTNENKNSLSVTNETKSRNLTWDESTFTEDEASGTWDNQRTVISKESKNSLSVTNENKN